MGEIFASCGHRLYNLGEPCLYDDFDREGRCVAWGVLCEDCQKSHIIFQTLEEGLEWVLSNERVER